MKMDMSEKGQQGEEQINEESLSILTKQLVESIELNSNLRMKYG